MIQITNPADCCGCTACASICNHDAITMKPDALGFLYPEVDTSKCTNCGLCEKVCAFNGKYNTSLNLPEPIAYGARHKDIEEVMRSRSGAVFAAITDYVLENGGVVYGAGYTDHFRVVHKRATTKEERDEFRGSKYVQSDMNIVFRQVKKDLKEGLTVLFSGTPCQSSALRNFLDKRLHDNLILLDVVCHGVPSPQIWSDYIHYVEKKYGNKIIQLDFRDKQLFGWNSHKETFIFECSNEKEVCKKTFYHNVTLRPSCYNCHFCNMERPSDITIGDYWGIKEEIMNWKDDNRGLNIVLCNTQKGCEIFNVTKSSLDYFIPSTKSYVQPNLIAPTIFNPMFKRFEYEYLNKGCAYVFEKNYNIPPLYVRVVNIIKRFLNKM